MYRLHSEGGRCNEVASCVVDEDAIRGIDAQAGEGQLEDSRIGFHTPNLGRDDDGRKHLRQPLVLPQVVDSLLLVVGDDADEVATLQSTSQAHHLVVHGRTFERFDDEIERDVVLQLGAHGGPDLGVACFTVVQRTIVLAKRPANVIEGDPGSGKTTLGIQFLLAGKSADVRAASKVHEDAVDKALRATLALLKSAGHEAADATKHAIGTTLRALLHYAGCPVLAVPERLEGGEPR